MKNKYISDQDILDKFGVEPSKVIDVEALAGDSSDNSGIPGINVKTLAELINEYKTRNLLKKLVKLSKTKKTNFN